jgi:cellulose synthase/poly-beta-1,6-N-acetylglucosamine synthase-like glycosyltransferase
MLEIVFWFSVAVLFYCYAGYGLILFAINKIKRIFFSIHQNNDEELPAVTLVVAAYNESAVLLKKINNCLEIDYPRHLLNLVFITDGSNDGSADLMQQYDFITLLHQSKREGKSAALKRAMRFVQTPVVIFSDANCLLNPGCVRAMVRHYANEKVGGVAGEKKILQSQRSSAVGQAEGMYWKYESFMKRQDADFNTVVGAAGELFSIRTRLFRAMEDRFILDDFILSMQVCLEGYRIEYEPGAFAAETSSATLAEEEKRKIRIAAGVYQCISYLASRVDIFRFPKLTFQYFSRRILRWVASPVLILFLLITNIELVMGHHGYIYNYFLMIQVLFYLLAFAGRIFIAREKRIGVFGIPFYFIFMNLCLVKGFIKYLQGNETVLWEKSIREAIE